MKHYTIDSPTHGINKLINDKTTYYFIIKFPPTLYGGWFWIIQPRINIWLKNSITTRPFTRQSSYDFFGQWMETLSLKKRSKLLWMTTTQTKVQEKAPKYKRHSIDIINKIIHQFHPITSCPTKYRLLRLFLLLADQGAFPQQWQFSAIPKLLHCYYYYSRLGSFHPLLYLWTVSHPYRLSSVLW